MLGEGTVLFGLLTGRGSGRVARNRLELFAQFAENQKFSSPLGPTPVDKRSTASEGRKMRWASSRAGAYAANRFSQHYHITGDESWFYLEYQHVSQWSVSRDEVSQRVNPAISTAKFMLTAFWDVNGFHCPI
jgi:hypothetical protein